MTRIRKLLLLLLVGAAWVSVACVSASLPSGADYRHRYFASLADLNQAKRAALVYSKLPDTPDEHVAAIADVLEEIDADILTFEKLRYAGGAKPADYESIRAVIIIAERRLRDYVKEDR